MKKELYKITEEDSYSKIKELSTRELKANIRRITKDYNKLLSEYRTKKIDDPTIEAYVEAAKFASKVEKPRSGELGLGLTNKTKDELREQMTALMRLSRSDLELVTTGWKEYHDRALEKFNRNIKSTGKQLSKAEYLTFIDTMNSVKAVLDGYGYSALATTLTTQYATASDKGRKDFVSIVVQAKKMSEGQKTSDFEKNLSNLLLER